MNHEGELVHEQVDGLITYRTYIQPDDTQVIGNALASGDDEMDTAVENEILERLNNGDTWAWASVYVEASMEDTEVTGGDSLGGCSYRNTAEFCTEDGYYPDMKGVALAQLNRRLAKACNALAKLTPGK